MASGASVRLPQLLKDKAGSYSDFSFPDSESGGGSGLLSGSELIHTPSPTTAAILPITQTCSTSGRIPDRGRLELPGNFVRKLDNVFLPQYVRGTCIERTESPGHIIGAHDIRFGDA